jgi:hypothetical protein
MLANILMSFFFFSLDIFLVALAGLLRLFPSILKTARIFLRRFMDLSFRFYQLIMGQVAPFFQHRWGFNILVGTMRVVSTVILSLILGLLLLLIFGFSINTWSVALCIFHGLAVGLVWGGTSQEVEGFRMGEDTE